MAIITFAPEYAEETVRMWRESKYQAIGVLETHNFESHVYFLNHILPKEFHIDIALVDKKVVGIIAYNESHISQLYIHIAYQGLGIGKRLLERAKDQSTGRLTLYTFEINTKAQQFYESNGFKFVGSGHENEENLSDILYAWTAESESGKISPFHSQN
ncbi:GNAT family N-acetyltransferase [Bacillus sp. CSS-39]|uniref:GNAT family N-acetyltransferase n=1 Tax=Bacillus haimaensis TaxID=3160967 RepID=UPI003AA7B3E3